MADEGAQAERIGRRASWRWCLAGGGALFILLGVALGIPSGAAGTGHGHRAAAGQPAPHRRAEPPRHGAHGRNTNTTTTANPATGLGAPLPVGSSDGTSTPNATVAPTTLPPVHSLDAGVPTAQSVPITTTGALLLVVIGFGAFGAGWAIGRRRAIPQG